MAFQAQVCPNCGAPLRLLGNQCSFCKVALAAVPASAPAAAFDPTVGAPPPGDPSAPFSMRVEDVFSIKKRGTVVTGTINAGTLRVGDVLVLDGSSGTRATSCTAIEVFRKTLDTAMVGETVGLMLAGIEKADVAAGDWLRSS